MRTAGLAQLARKCASILAGFTCFLCSAGPTGGTCYDPKALCDDPCPCLNSCYSDEDCPAGQICVEACLPSACWCEEGAWRFPPDCGGECIEPFVIPGPPTHTIVDLGTLGGRSANAWAVNDLGEVVGEGDMPTGRRHAFLWRDGEMIDLTPDFGTLQSTARDVNDFSEVIINTVAERAFVWRAGDLTELRTSHSVTRSVARAINEQGEIVGSALIRPGGMQPARWNAQNEFEDIYEHLGIASFRVDDIDNLGNMVGAIGTKQGIRAVLIATDKVTELGVLGGQYSSASRINELNQVVGVSERAPGGDRIFYPFFWENGSMIDILAVTGRGAAGGTRGPALNNCGELLLFGDAPGRGVSFFWYRPGEPLRPLWGLTRPYSDWDWLIPNDINDRGQIAGYGVKDGLYRAFLINPVLGDLDGDGDADLGDFGIFDRRFTSRLLPWLPTCERADFDGDADVDLGDHEIFNSNFTGPK